jgi:hypothetical protein
MSTSVMMERIAEASPRFKARITGVFYLLTMLTGIFAQGFVSGRLPTPRLRRPTYLRTRACFSWGSRST